MIPVSCPSNTVNFATCATHLIVYMPGSTGWHKLCAKHWKPRSRYAHNQRQFDKSNPGSLSFGHSWLRNLCYPLCSRMYRVAQVGTSCVRSTGNPGADMRIINAGSTSLIPVSCPSDTVGFATCVTRCVRVYTG